MLLFKLIFVDMMGKLILESAGITQMLFAQALFSRTLHKWSRFSFLKPVQVPYVNKPCLGFQIYTSQQFNLFPARSAETKATPVKENVFSELKKLMKNGLLRKKDVDKALGNEASYGDLNNSLLVLKCISKLPDISPENRVALSEKFLNKVKTVTGVVTEDHCLQVLECYLQSKYFENLDSFLSTMKNYGVQDSKKIRLSVFKCLSLKGLGKKDFDLTKELESSDLHNSEELIAVKIYNLAVSGSTNKALEEIKKMKKNDVNIGAKIYTSLLKAVALKGDKNSIEELIRDVCLDGITFSHDEILDILENVVISKKYNLIPDVKILCVDEVLLKASHILLIKLLHCNKIESAYNFMNYLFHLRFICESADEELLFNAMCKSFIEESSKLNCSVNDLLEKCKQLRKLKKCLYSLEYALYCCLKKGDISGSLAILQAMFNDGLILEAHYFWPLFITLKKSFGDEGIIFVLDKMVDLKVPLNAETLLDYIFPNLSNLECTNDIMERVYFNEAQQQLLTEVFVLYTIQNGLVKKGVEFTAKYPLRKDVSYKFLAEDLTKALVKNPHCEEIVILAKETNAVDPLSAISKLWIQGNEEDMVRLSEYFKKHEIYTENAEGARDLVKRNRNHPLIKKAVSAILNPNPVTGTKPTPSNTRKCRYDELAQLEEAEVILAELTAKGMNTTGQKLRLIKMYLRNQFYEKAVKAKKEALQLMGDEAEFSPGYLVMLARLSAYENDMENSIRYLNTLKGKYPNFALGCVTGLSLCLNFIQNGRFKEMLSVLQALPKWEGKVGNLSPRPLHVLKQVALLGMPELTDVVFKIMERKRYIEPDVNSLQVYTSSYLNANDLDGAVKEYCRIAEDLNLISNTRSVLDSAVKADRLDVVDVITNLCLSITRSKAPLVSALTVIASKGDIKLLMDYSEKLQIPLNDDFIIRKFAEGMTSYPTLAYETLIKAAAINKLPYGHFVQVAAQSILKAKDYKGAVDFLNFCTSNEIRLSKKLRAKLLVFSKLGEIDGALVSGKEEKNTRKNEESPEE